VDAAFCIVLASLAYGIIMQCPVSCDGQVRLPLLGPVAAG